MFPDQCVVMVCVCVLQGLILRDFVLLTVISVGFEVLEYTLEPQLPNFGECWWDHVRKCVDLCCYSNEEHGSANLPLPLTSYKEYL